jgi:integrase
MTRNTDPSSRVLVLPVPAVDVEGLIGRWLAEHVSAETRKGYGATVRRLFAEGGFTHPRQIDMAAIVAYCNRPGLANNTVRHYLAAIRSFLKWCTRHGVIDGYDDDGIRSLVGRFPRVYGKAQAPRPARWLSKEEAFGALLVACQDGTDLGLRDELVIRFGLLGMRRGEVRSLTVKHMAQLPRLEWIGKRKKLRRATAGPQLVAVIGRYLDAYQAGLSAPLEPHLPLLCPTSPAKTGVRVLQWGTAPTGHNFVYRIVTKRAEQAGLGHLAPHDLRRTAAGILHRSRDANGKHDFDLLDIQQVLGHSDPAVTMRCYLEPMDTEIIDRAADFLD